MMSSIHPARLRLTAVALLAASTLLFGIGVAVERSSNPPTTSSTTSASPEPSGHVEGSGTEGSVNHDSDSGAAEQGLAGLNLEGIPAVAGAVLVSAAVAAGLWFWWRRPLFLILAALYAGGFAVLDAREVVHQVAVGQPIGASLAVAVTALHVTTAAAVLLLIRAAMQKTRVAA